MLCRVGRKLGQDGTDCCGLLCCRVLQVVRMRSTILSPGSEWLISRAKVADLHLEVRRVSDGMDGEC